MGSYGLLEIIDEKGRNGVSKTGGIHIFQKGVLVVHVQDGYSFLQNGFWYAPPINTANVTPKSPKIGLN